MRDLVRAEEGAGKQLCRSWIPEPDRLQLCRVHWLKTGMNRDLFLKKLLLFRQNERSRDPAILKRFLGKVLNETS